MVIIIFTEASESLSGARLGLEMSIPSDKDPFGLCMRVFLEEVQT